MFPGYFVTATPYREAMIARTSRAMEEFAQAAGKETMMLPLLNGMRHIDVLVRRFGDDAVLGGVCLIAAEIDLQGRIVQLSDLNTLLMGKQVVLTACDHERSTGR